MQRLPIRFPTRLPVWLAAAGVLALAGCGTVPASSYDDGRAGAGRAATGKPAAVPAKMLMRLTEVHEATGMTLLEGPAFGEDGRLLVVDVTAPEGEPKLMSVDVRGKTSRALFTDGRGAYTSAQFGPHDGRIYLTDFAGGVILSLAPDGGDPRTFFSGEVDGARMNPDDLAFDPEGNLYVSDSRGYREGEDRGRVVRIDRDTRKATVLADGMAAPNGISFDEEHRGLWVSELTENRISYFLLDGKGGAASRHTAIRVDGGVAQTDSIAVDADGNLYQALHGRPAMAVYDRHGERLATVEVPEADAEGLESATNVAITPGGTKAYMTVSGPAGGYLYTFKALAEGTRQSNGG
ncbi:SMP-30/gluconolactonase/LRE family protein [Streptomyces sp. UH6]|uniref:SMP-30/gluconolactonase/LRE family protein n=1 Tax=Streptomyces sp. UH6 TaxID=2748379 RepID=UPI0015D49FBD|nr:SMP-30/gluconolactonase/LRE family protein [Streptomyces sp. UH6]NYV77597.1 SMP-30/gluconolactonase/LRE family protein [Streptomyces sp. UH6]